jgi:hypothetical protein
LYSLLHKHPNATEICNSNIPLQICNRFATNYQPNNNDVENGCKSVAKNKAISFTFIYIFSVAISLQIVKICNGIAWNIIIKYKRNFILFPLQSRCKFSKFATELQWKIKIKYGKIKLISVTKIVGNLQRNNKIIYKTN